ncbi:MAG: DUF5906 domain-containing protein [Pseudomonadota bacterium]
MTAIVPDGRISTATFTAEQTDTMMEWVASKVGHENLYCQVNSSGDKSLTRKASKSDIVAAEFLHVDLDAPGGVSADELPGARTKLLEKLREFGPAPSAILDSGGGYQAFWRLSEPTEDLEDVEGRNRWIAEQLGGDCCHNIDRIMRLPGTINLPNKKKRKLGRVPVPARIVAMTDEVVDRGDFSIIVDEVRKPAVAAPVAAPKQLTAEEMNRLPPRVLHTAVYNANPDGEPYADRSEGVWFMCCEAVREGLDDDVILGLLLDPQNKVSEHIYDQKHPDKYARKQVQDARAEVAESGGVLQAINRDYFAAKVGGHARYFRDQFPLEGMPEQTFKFEIAPMHLPGKKEGTIVPAYPVWRAWSGRRYYSDGFTLDPDNPGHTDTRYNLWQGYGVEPSDADPAPFLRHLDEVIEPDARDYVWRWICWIVQNPARKPKVAVVLRGDEGTGKGLIGEALMRIFGEHGLQVTSKDQVTGRFNSHLRHCCLLFADEADFTRGDDDGVLKGLITEDRITIEAKGVDLKQERSYVSVLMSTNREWAVPAGKGARRFVVADVSSLRKGDYEHWNELWTWMRGPGCGAILGAALREDLGSFSPEADRVVTQALREQKAASLTGLDRVLYDIVADGAWPGIVPTKELQDRCKPAEVTVSMIGRRLNEFGWKKRDVRPRGYEPPHDLRALRERMFPDFGWDDAQWFHEDLYPTGPNDDDVPF